MDFLNRHLFLLKSRLISKEQGMENDLQRVWHVNPYTYFGFKKLFDAEKNKNMLIKISVRKKTMTIWAVFFILVRQLLPLMLLHNLWISEKTLFMFLVLSHFHTLYDRGWLACCCIQFHVRDIFIFPCPLYRRHWDNVHGGTL